MTVFPGGFMMPVTDVSEAWGGIIPGKDEGKKDALLGAGRGRDEEDAQEKTR